MFIALQVDKSRVIRRLLKGLENAIANMFVFYSELEDDPNMELNAGGRYLVQAIAIGYRVPVDRGLGASSTGPCPVNGPDGDWRVRSTTSFSHNS